MPSHGQIWASLPIPAITLDAADRILAINPASEEFLNITERAVACVSVFDRLHFDADVAEITKRVREQRSPIFVNDASVGVIGRPPIHCTIQFASLNEGDGDILMLISPREIAGWLGRSHETKNAAISAIGMAEMLAHEIKNPLAGIIGAAQLLSMSLDDDETELTDLIVSETRRIAKLLEQVEQFGDLRPPHCSAVNIHDLLDRARKSASVGLAANMTFREDYDPSLPLTWADGDQLLQVFLNLLNNAAQAARPGGGTIRLRTFYEPSLRVRVKDGPPAPVPLQVEIVDDGPGIPPRIADSIFEPFVSGRENGTGLGLALVSKIITDHGGWITVDSVAGRTAFRISLPVATDDSGDRTHHEGDE